MSSKMELVALRTADQVSCLLLVDDQPVDLIRSGAFNRHDLFLGRINRVVPALGAAFLDLAPGQTGLLPLQELAAGAKAGQQLLVQLKQEKSAPKSHLLTTRIRLAGPFAVFRPGLRPLRRSKLQDLPATEADQFFTRDLDRLEKLWQEAKISSQSGPVPRLVLPLGEPCHQALASWASSDLDQITTDDQKLYDLLFAYLSRFWPEKLPALHFWRPDYASLAATKGLTDLERQLKRRLLGLPGQGNIVIEQTEALTVIDVNSGSDLKGQDEGQLRLRTNLAAAKMLARHLRLRNIGGMVVIDFLRMDQAGQAELTAALQSALTGDRGRIRLLGFTAMGLFELVRTPA